ncbi:MAG TPA: toprim domain-containing protein [Candidatus Bathyarchaeia archaeon]|nr:toprim domain-containing protein [Candidatus Bathyarchaeia archaeon]
MPTALERKAEMLTELIQKLAVESTKGVPIIVEGQKDVGALRQLNIEGKIVSSKTSGKSFLDILTEIENLKVKEVVLLLDFDRRGVEWTHRLKQHLEKTRIKPNLNFWNQLYGLVGRDLKDIEGLPAYLGTLENKKGSQKR